MLNLQVTLKRLHFDRIKVERERDRVTERSLKKFGAYVRRAAQQSLRKKKKGDYSPPGHPPYSHGDQKLKKGILFAYERETKTVVIGPRLYDRSARFMIPRLHEVGGNDDRGKFEKRDFMVPAAMKELSKLKSFFLE